MNMIFLALSDPTRREILRVLRERDFTAGELSERFPLAKSTLSGHFNVLKNAGLIIPEKNGTSIVYSLNLSVFEQTVAAIWELLGVQSGGDAAPGPKISSKSIRVIGTSPQTDSQRGAS